MDGEASVLPRSNFFGQQQPQVSEEACVNLKNALYLSLNLGSGQDEPSGCWSFSAQGRVTGRATNIPGHQATVSSV